jgi:hypothetical protein
VITISQSYLEKDQIKGITFYGDYVIGHAQLRSEELEIYLNNSEFDFHFIGIDHSLISKISQKTLSRESVFVYDESQINDLLVSNLIINLSANNKSIKVKTYGQSSDLPAHTHAMSLAHISAGDDQPHKIVVTLVTKPVLDVETFDKLLQGTDHLVFVRSEDIPLGILVQEHSKVHRLESRKHFDGNIVSLIESLKPSIIANEIKTFNGVGVVSSGLVAPIGTIVVDNIESPTCILGVASGHGTLLNEKESSKYLDRIQSVSEILLGIKLRAARSGD